MIALVALVSATGSTAMGRRSAPQLAAPLRPGHSRAGRQQRRHRLPVRQSGSGAARNCLRGDGHSRTTLHQSAPPHRARQCLRRPAAAPETRLCIRYDRRPARFGTLVGPLIDGRASSLCNAALSEANAGGARITGGERVHLNAHDPELSMFVRRLSRCPRRPKSSGAKPSRPSCM